MRRVRSRGPADVSIPAGRYDIILESFDQHVVGDDTQPNEQWFIQAWDGETLVFTSNAISDLPDDQNTLIETVNTDVALDARA